MQNEKYYRIWTIMHFFSTKLINNIAECWTVLLLQIKKYECVKCVKNISVSFKKCNSHCLIYIDIYMITL